MPLPVTREMPALRPSRVNVRGPERKPPEDLLFTDGGTPKATTEPGISSRSAALL